MVPHFPLDCSTWYEKNQLSQQCCCLNHYPLCFQRFSALLYYASPKLELWSCWWWGHCLFCARKCSRCSCISLNFTRLRWFGAVWYGDSVARHYWKGQLVAIPKNCVSAQHSTIGNTIHFLSENNRSLRDESPPRSSSHRLSIIAVIVEGQTSIHTID